jgi:hypothetical protein
MNVGKKKGKKIERTATVLKLGSKSLPPHPEQKVDRNG